MVDTIMVGVKRALFRFPVSFTAILYIYLHLCLKMLPNPPVFIQNYLGWRDASLIFMAVLCAALMFTMARIMAEAHGWSRFWELLTGLILTALLYSLLITHPANSTDPVIVFTAVLGLTLAPFLMRRSDDFSFWQYNNTLWCGAFLAVLSGMILLGGSLAAVGASDYLFGTTWFRSGYNHISLLIAGLFIPVLILCWAPQTYSSTEEECRAPRGIHIILNWILAPLGILYFLILYAYGAKILIEWELPRGKVAGMVTGFGLLGIFIFLCGWPLRETGGALLRFIYRHFFSLLIAPSVLMLAGVHTRVAQYGFTEERFMMMIVGVWMLGLSVFYTLRPRASIRIIPLALMVLCFFSCIGFWDAVSVSERSQLRRFEEILTRNGMLVDAKLVPLDTPLPQEDHRTLYTIIEYFHSHGRLYKISFVIPELPLRKGFDNMWFVQDKLGLTRQNPFTQQGERPTAQPRRTYFTTTYSGATELGDYREIVNNFSVEASGADSIKVYERAGGGLLYVKTQGLSFRVEDDKGRSVLLDIEKPLRSHNNGASSPQSLRVEGANGGLKVRFEIFNANLTEWPEEQAKPPHLSASGLLLLSAD